MFYKKSNSSSFETLLLLVLLLLCVNVVVFIGIFDLFNSFGFIGVSTNILKSLIGGGFIIGESSATNSSSSNDTNYILFIIFKI